MNEETTAPSTRNTPPGPRGLPIFGSLLSLRNDPHLALHRISQKYGDICLIRFGNVPTVIISHPDLLREAFDRSELADRWVSDVMGVLSSYGQDLAMAPYGEHWRQLQRFANRELLSLRNLQQIRERYIVDAIKNLVEEIGEKSDSGQLIAPIEMISRSNATIMFQAIFGRSTSDTSEFESRREELLQFVFWAFQNASAANPADYIPWLKLLPNNAIKQAEKQAKIRDDILRFLIDSVRARPDLDLDRPSCLIEVMLAEEQAGKITQETIQLLIGDLLLAGIDTSAQTISWLLLILANRPQIQSKIHEELDQVIGADQLPTIEDRDRMTYLNAVILEDMRYRTVGPLALPHKAAKTCRVGGFTIAEGTQVLANIYSIHHDPKFWDSPDEFLPERFMPQNDGSPSPAMTGNAFMPFGVGHRACPGRRFGEVLVWLHASRLLHRFQFQTANSPDGKLSEAEVFGLTVGPEPYELKVTRR